MSTAINSEKARYSAGRALSTGKLIAQDLTKDGKVPTVRQLHTPRMFLAYAIREGSKEPGSIDPHTGRPHFEIVEDARDALSKPPFKGTARP